MARSAVAATPPCQVACGVAGVTGPLLLARGASRRGGRAPIALKRGACTSRERACRVRAALVCRHGEPPGADVRMQCLLRMCY